MSTDLESKAANQQWIGIIICGLLAVVIGSGLGFVNQALLPVKTMTALPKPDPKKPGADKLPSIFWLKQATSKEIGSYTTRDKEIRAGQPTSLNDKEINQWMKRVFGKDEAEVLKEDMDAKLGIPFVRIGGQLPGTEKDPVLTVTMPFTFKLFTLPVSDVYLQFTARPVYDGGQTRWTFSNAHMGHARIPDSMADETVTRAIAEIAETRQGTKDMKHLLTAYQRIVIQDNKLVLQAPVKIAPLPEPEKKKAPAPAAPATPEKAPGVA